MRAATSAGSKLRGYVALAAALRAGRATPRAYHDACLKRIDRHAKCFRAYVT